MLNKIRLWLDNLPPIAVAIILVIAATATFLASAVCAFFGGVSGICVIYYTIESDFRTVAMMFVASVVLLSLARIIWIAYQCIDDQLW